MFTDIKPVARPIVKLVDNLEPYWIPGFITAEGCLSINLREKVDCKAGYEAGLRLSLSQNARDLELINKLKDFFNAGYVVSSDKRNSVELTIKKFSALKQDVVPFLDRYTLQGAKRTEFNDFKSALRLMEDKVHLTKEGYNIFKALKDGMNTGRKQD